MNIVILAAGQGKRMRSELPKVLHPLAGRALLAHVLATAHALKPQAICVIYGHGGSAVPDHFEDVSAPDHEAAVTWARQEPQLGTGHAVMQALPHLKDAAQTLVLYGDVPLTRVETLQRLITAAGHGVGILTVDLDDPTGYGRIVRDAGVAHDSGTVRDAGTAHDPGTVRDPLGRIMRIVEQKDATPAERAITEVNTGIMVLPTSRLRLWLDKLGNDNAQKEYYLTDVVALAVADGVPVNGAKPDAVWETLGVNSRAQLAELERTYQRNLANQLLEDGVTLADPARIDIRGTLAAGKDCSIDVNCVFEGDVALGDGVSIGPHCVIKNVSIAAGTRIEAFCHLEDAEVGARCRIGPYARLRPAAVLGEDVHIGNFVEVKASRIGDGSKANHLSYVGDATVGKNVNIGAGTITCNYDGANKHRTVIEDDVHIGSDTQLVAPVTIGRGSTTAAGATVFKDVPPGGLVLTKAEQVFKPGWQRPLKKPKQ